MAWNKYYIFVSNQEKTDIETILSKLGLNDYKAVSEVDLYATNKPKTLFISKYKGFLIIVHPDLVFQFFNNDVSDTEKLFIDNFPNSVIAAIYSNESVGGFGFSLIENGQRIRVKHGSDGEIYCDIGTLVSG